VLKAILVSARPRQWTKNLLVYFALLFTVNQEWKFGDSMEVVHLFGRSTAAFGLFCLATSAIYILNDLVDAEKDRNHPRKRYRPAAMGTLTSVTGLVASLFMVSSGLVLAWILDRDFGGLLLIYLVAMLAYSGYLKRIVIVDIMVISGGFVLRAAAGAVVIDATISPWLYICTSLGALFLGFAKRLSELVVAGKEAQTQRETLQSYSPRLLEQLIAIVAPATLVSYILYTFSANNLPDNHSMMLTIPFVMYGLFRYLYLVHDKNLGESPEEILLRDVPTIINLFLWLTTVCVVLVVFR
jgi:4-hydroxybenzoate polyprenyltransferase